MSRLPRPRHHSRIAFASLVILLITSLAACGSSNGTSASGAKPQCPLHILLVTGLTGVAGYSGQADLGGTKAGVDEVNKAGGVLGCKLVLDVRDDGSNFAQSLPLMEAAASNYHYPLVMNPDIGAPTTAPYINSHKLLEIIADETGQTAEPEVPFPTIFETILLSPHAMDVATQYALSQGYKRIAVIVDNTTTGTNDLKAMTPLVQAAGASITDTERVDEAGIDFTSAVERARASNPQVVLMDIFQTAAAHVLTEIHDIGWKVPIVGGTDLAASNFKGLVPVAYLNGGVVASQASMAYPSNAVTERFIQQIQAEGVTISQYLFGYTAQYDAVLLFAWAAQQTHSLDAETIAQKLHDSGHVAIPGLVDSQTTGYSPTSGEWNGRVAIMKMGFYNLGRLPLIRYATAPPLPKGM
jgi:branched-chain amino acid transport system substrate-binding protein